MYCPYFRGKRHELAAIRQWAELTEDSSKIAPIIEPVRENLSDLERTLDVLREEGASVVVIGNPQVGELIGKETVLQRGLFSQIAPSYPGLSVGYLITEGSRERDISIHLERLNSFDLSLVHASSHLSSGEVARIETNAVTISKNIYLGESCSRSYQMNAGQGRKIIVEDCFNAQTRNADYPEDEFFTDLNISYEADGFAGFGDFSIVGKKFSGGGPAHAVAIHVVYPSVDNDIRIKHFVSDRTEGPEDPAGKFMEALRKLVRYIHSNSDPRMRTAGIEGFLDLHRADHYPQLGKVKELSMLHHLLLVDNLL